MKALLPIRILYAVAAAYDGLLGLAFIAAAPQVYEFAGITPPNHWGYIHFAAGLLVIFGLMFLTIALRPVENRNLIGYGILLKVCYVATVGWHWYHGGVPNLWKYFALADVVFAVLFFWSAISLESATDTPKPKDTAAPA
ncbi:MAG: hypothetical protein ABSG50_13875 [Opitutaceae bacterium]|jgi:hypothetical protein